MSLPALYDINASQYFLGRKLGGGGEGEVYELKSGNAGLVAKIYKTPLTQQKIEKLRAMTTSFDTELESISAWPERLLFDTNRVVRGFAMPQVVNYHPIHELFNPAARKKYFPQADYSFLIQAARNVVAAFGTIHSHGCIVGDVNEGNILVSKEAVVKLIDCDSFQIRFKEKIYPCEVGVPLYTPPELQGSGDFGTKPRNESHDLFGMGILLFQLLFMGRHPYVGVYPGPEMPLEKAIANFHFSYGATARQLGISPPTGALNYDTFLPPSLQSLFNECFSKSGLVARPNANSWMREMMSIKSRLRRCNREPKHSYFDNLSICPFCQMEETQGVYFFNPTLTTVFDPTGLSLGQVWQQILAISPPPINEPGDPSISNYTIDWLSASKLLWLFSRLQRISAFVVPFLLFQSYSSLTLLWIILGVFIYHVNPFERWYLSGRQKFAQALSIEEAKWSDVKAQWSTSASTSVFMKALSQLELTKSNYESLGRNYAKERKELEARVRELQLKKFLSNYFISHCDIPNIGDNRKYILRSFGVETAADIEKLRTKRVRGIGPFLVRQLNNWRDSIKRGFKFDPSLGIDKEELGKLNRKYELLKVQYANSLRDGPTLLNRTKANILQARKMLQPKVNAVAVSYATAMREYSSY